MPKYRVTLNRMPEIVMEDELVQVVKADNEDEALKKVVFIITMGYFEEAHVELVDDETEETTTDEPVTVDYSPEDDSLN